MQLFAGISRNTQSKSYKQWLSASEISKKMHCGTLITKELYYSLLITMPYKSFLNSLWQFIPVLYGVWELGFVGK